MELGKRVPTCGVDDESKGALHHLAFNTQPKIKDPQSEAANEPKSLIQRLIV